MTVGRNVPQFLRNNTSFFLGMILKSVHKFNIGIDSPRKKLSYYCWISGLNIAISSTGPSRRSEISAMYHPTPRTWQFTSRLIDDEHYRSIVLTIYFKSSDYDLGNDPNTHPITLKLRIVNDTPLSFLQLKNENRHKPTHTISKQNHYKHKKKPWRQYTIRQINPAIQKLTTFPNHSYSIYTVHQ